ncbi:helix-turn-helix domain-containing protein [Zavarzinella formosa]|uniref:helix-turn-helix domain-containing protein n=1 Tax=Zavarzinella formosa TaxID=360055 RepID=UPI0003800651|nr:helix-turn-helix domain-containing protein [Zavarzinella formosa]
MGRPTTLSRDGDRFKVRKGWKVDDDKKSPVTFYLGYEEPDARLRAARLELLWNYARDRFQGWEDGTLQIAKAIGKGDESVTMVPPKDFQDGEALVHWVKRFPPEDFARLITVVHPSIQRQLAEYNAQRQQAIDEQKKQLEQFINVGYPNHGNAPEKTGYLLADAVARFKKEENERLRESEWSKTQERHLDYALSFLTNVEDVGDLTAEAIRQVNQTIASRPLAKTRQANQSPRPISEAWAKHSRKTFKAFIEWLDTREDIPFQKPVQREFRPVRVVRTQRDRAKSIARGHIDPFTTDELRLIWRYARPRERVYMLLALNCAMKHAEIVSLQREEIMFRQHHPRKHVVTVISDAGDSWLMRFRGKSEVMAEWKLWRITVEALEWHLKQNPDKESHTVIQNKNGSQMTRNQISNKWNTLIKRIRKDHPKFRHRSFKHLEKTAATVIFSMAGGEVSSMFISHGEPTKDLLLKHYAELPWGTLHSTLSNLEKRWTEIDPVFTGVENPFPEKVKQSGPNISQEQIRQIIELAKQGLSTVRIAARLGLTWDTVDRWRKRGNI